MDKDELAKALRRFAAERDWDQFHSPKNLTMALGVEVAEIAEHFQWLTEEETRALPDDDRERVAAELADVQIYLVRLADMLGVDLDVAVEAKIEQNERKYPAAQVRGSRAKYTDCDDGSQA